VAIDPTLRRRSLDRERASLTRLGVLAALAVLLAQVHLPGRPSTLCTLRALTGVPCPLCGGTTAAVHVGRADLLGALRASPLAVLGAVVAVAVPLVREWIAALPRRSVPAALIGALALSELWQLHRFGWI
jgi:hypothetical protein